MDEKTLQLILTLEQQVPTWIAVFQKVRADHNMPQKTIEDYYRESQVILDDIKAVAERESH